MSGNGGIRQETIINQVFSNVQISEQQKYKEVEIRIQIYKWPITKILANFLDYWTKDISKII